MSAPVLPFHALPPMQIDNSCRLCRDGLHRQDTLVWEVLCWRVSAPVPMLLACATSSPVVSGVRVPFSDDHITFHASTVIQNAFLQ
jgi:hypothetical protein